MVTVTSSFGRNSDSHLSKQVNYCVKRADALTFAGSSWPSSEMSEGPESASQAHFAGTSVPVSNHLPSASALLGPVGYRCQSA